MTPIPPVHACVTAITDVRPIMGDPMKHSQSMRKSLISAFVLVLSLTQLSWPMPAHHASDEKAPAMAMAAHPNHSMSGGSHDCCPKMSVSFTVQLPISRPCHSRHECCVSSNEVPALPSGSRQSRSDFDLAILPLEETAPTGIASATAPPRRELPSRDFFLVVLRI